MIITDLTEETSDVVPHVDDRNMLATRARRTCVPMVVVEQVCDSMATGLSLRQSCEQANIATGTFIKQLKSNLLYKTMYENALEYQTQMRTERIKEVVDVGINRLATILEDDCKDPKHEAVQVQAFDKIAKVAGLYSDGSNSTSNTQINITPSLPDKTRLSELATVIEVVVPTEEDDDDLVI